MTVQEAIEKSTEDLQRRLEDHRDLLRRFVDREDEAAGVPSGGCRLTGCRHEMRLKATLVEIIEVLEQTRKAFRSKQLEKLRLRLLRMLADEPGQ